MKHPKYELRRSKHMDFRVRVKDVQWGALGLFIVYSVIVVCFLFNEIERHEEEQYYARDNIKLVWDRKKRERYFLSHDEEGNQWFKDQKPTEETKGRSPPNTDKYFLAVYTATQTEFMERTYENIERDIAALKQWIHYLIIAGVEHFYVCNTWYSKEHIMADHLESYITQGVVTYLPMHHNASAGLPLQEAQAKCYGQLLSTLQNRTEWIMNINIYEYPYIDQDTKYGFLSRHLQSISPQVNGSQRQKAYTDITTRYLRIDGPVDTSQNIVTDRGRYLLKTKPEYVSPLYRPSSRHVPPGASESNYNVTPIIEPYQSEELVLISYIAAARPELSNWADMKTEITEFQNLTLEIGPALRKSLMLYGEKDAYLPT